ncbi:PREDICTED: cyclin-A2 isoform X2 [Trachymyrmex cornetzi]|uniref:Cyclin-A2 n=1 Tax=Trachymyrmex cornetzi TaxID=471704 RepID=A0A195ENW5_9HYME|nr:PREDICTED: cyclin-A2 isoform X2 [Trachymyrmex cornetzi]KYN29589.1 Cyclin-A2 [Trachymyrmex cornetzi]
MAAIRIHQEDQENRIIGDLRGRGKENLVAATAAAVSTQTQVLHQSKRAVLGVLHTNCPRNGTKPEIYKDEKYVKAKPFIPMQSEPFKIYEEDFYNKEEPTIKIYEDKLEEETSVVLRNSKENKEIKETTAKSDKEQPRLEIHTIDSTSTYAFCNKIEEVDQIKKDDILLKDSPMSLGMSLEKSLTYSSSSNEEYRLRRECNKELRINIFDVDEYRADIYNYLRTSESLHRPKSGYMKKQPDITYSMRSILIDWLVEVAEEYRLQDETLYLAISYIDRFLSYMSVVRSKLQLVGTAAMFIAAKYEEIYPPDVGEFVYITDDTYSKTQVIKMENLILRVLSFDLTVPTHVTFLMEYCISNNLSEKIKFLAMYLCELSMLEGDPYLQYLPSHLAASAIALARHTLHEEIWPHELELSTGYNLKTLKECIAYLNRTFSNAPNFQQTAIQEKYRSSKYGHVSMLLPRSTEAVSCEDEDEEGNA